MHTTQVLQFDIEGEIVLCYQMGDERLWHCPCTYFKTMRKQHGEGFCPHIALAVDEAERNGVIAFRPLRSRRHYGPLH